MKIVDVIISPLKAPLIMPFRIATGQHDSLDNVLVTITLENGSKGYGEAAVATHITGETVDGVTRSLQQFTKHLIGRDIGSWLSLSHLAKEAMGNNKSALAAVDTALYDALTRLLKIPLWRLWQNGGRKPRRFATDVTIVIGSLEETIKATTLFYQQGIRAFKVKIGREMDLDFKRVCSIKAIVGKSPILLDANQGYTAKETLRFLSMMERAGIAIALIEQPVKKTDWEGLKEVTRKSKVPVCADESVGTVENALRAIHENAVDVINIKLMKTGLTEAISIMQLAKAKGIKLMMGGMMESNIAMTAAAHLVVGMGGVDFVDLDTPFFVKGAVAKNPMLSDKGHWDLADSKPGLGLNP